MSASTLIHHQLVKTTMKLIADCIKLWQSRHLTPNKINHFFETATKKAQHLYVVKQDNCFLVTTMQHPKETVRPNKH